MKIGRRAPLRFRGTQWATLILSLSAGGCFAHRYATYPRVAIVDSDPVVQMVDPKMMAEAFEPPLVPLARHTHPPAGRRKLLGIADLSPPRAYPIGLLDRVEVVNDSWAGREFVVTRCALTHVAAVFDRRLGGRTLRFENSGALWRDTLVLKDLETGTYWSAATGRALSGPLAGETLRAIPAVFTTAAAWARAYPDSMYLDLGQRTSVPLAMRLYALSPWQGVSGRSGAGGRYRAKREVWIVSVGNEAFAFTQDEILRIRHIETTLAGGRLEILWDARLSAPRAWRTASPRQEVPVQPMYWFALERHFARVTTLPDRPGAR